MMKKKLLFMFAAIIMVAGTIFQTKAYRCGVNTGCPDGYSCYHGVCRAMYGGGPTWNGFKPNYDEMCCERAYHDDECNGSWSSC